MSSNTEYAIVIEAGTGKGRFGPDVEITTYPSYEDARTELAEIIAGRRPGSMSIEEGATAVELTDSQYLIVDKKKLGSTVLTRLSLGRVSARPPT
jgi:hypothetical protein